MINLLWIMKGISCVTYVTVPLDLNRVVFPVEHGIEARPSMNNGHKRWRKRLE
jgi:hypothetical protein